MLANPTFIAIFANETYIFIAKQGGAEGMGKKQPTEKRTTLDRLEALALSFISGITTLLAKFGLPGIFLGFLAYYASEEQRKEFIDKFILLKNLGKWWVGVVILGVIAVTLGQKYYYEREKKELERQILAIRAELEQLQARILKTIKRKRK